MIGVDGEGFDQSKVLVVRSRCVVDEKGNLVARESKRTIAKVNVPVLPDF